MNVSFLALISADKIRVAAFQMGRLKVHGPNGFQGVFYQSFWDYLMVEVNGLI